MEKSPQGRFDDFIIKTLLNHLQYTPFLFYTLLPLHFLPPYIELLDIR